MHDIYSYIRNSCIAMYICTLVTIQQVGFNDELNNVTNHYNF